MRLQGRTLRMAAWWAALALKGIARSIRWQEEGAAPIVALRAQGQPILLAFWHGRLAMIPHAYARLGGRRVKILISEHRDGELIAQAMSHWGYGAVRGSSRRGAVKGARGMWRAAQQGWDLAITPDGPQGPREHLQEGVLELARWTGLPIVPVCFAVGRAWTLGSWDRFCLPKPFTRGIVLWGEPVWVPRDADAALVAALGQDLQARMVAQRQMADHAMGCHEESW